MPLQKATMASLLPSAAARGFAAPKSLWTARGLPCAVWRAVQQPQSAQRAAVAARSFAYDAATAPTATGTAEIGEVDFEPAAANTGGCSLGWGIMLSRRLGTHVGAAMEGGFWLCRSAGCSANVTLGSLPDLLAPLRSAPHRRDGPEAADACV